MKYIKTYEQRFLTEDDYITNIDLPKDENTIWSVFYISNGHKYFMSKLYKQDKTWTETKLKYSDPEVLKFTEEEATKIAHINKQKNRPNYSRDKIGIVNDKGVQKLI